MNAELVAVTAKSIAGINCRTDNLIEQGNNEDGQRIAKLWQQFFDEQVMNQIPHQLGNGVLYGIYYDYASDLNGQYNVMAGVEVDSTLPEQMTEPFSLVGINAANYLRFTASGDMPGELIKLWHRIWRYFEAEACPWQRLYQTDFERYSKPEYVEVYIGVTEEIE